MITASAPIDHNVLDFLQVCFCCPMLEGYGLSESSGAASFTFTEDPLSGHVGGPVKSVKFRLKDVPEMQYLSTDKPYPRGELCMQGPIIFKGYYKNQEKTREAFDEEGWFQTGDVVQLYPNGTVKIIDRAKNIFKLSQGEYVAPEKLENIFVLSPYIAQSMIYGDSLKNCVIGVIVADPPAAKDFAKRNGLDENDLQAVVENADFKKEILDDIARLGRENKLTGLEKPKEIFVTLDPFSVDNDMLTPTFKLKRNVCKQVYQDHIDKMYAELAARGI
jgi:long-chain acyl-CoA synthetase